MGSRFTRRRKSTFSSRIRSKTGDFLSRCEKIRKALGVNGVDEVSQVPRASPGPLRAFVFPYSARHNRHGLSLPRTTSVFTRVFLWSLYFLAVSFAKKHLGGHGSPSIPWAGGGGPSESQFHSVFPVVFVISWPFPSLKSSLASLASHRKLLGRSRGLLSSVSIRCIFSMKTSPL